MTRNALAVRNNEAWGLGKKTSETLEDKLKNIYKYYFDKLETSREVILIYKELREDEINVGKLETNLGHLDLEIVTLTVIELWVLIRESGVCGCRVM